jgi:carbon storage regulator
MLVLTRRIGEELLIGDHILVTVLTVKGNRVRLGITAPSSVPVARSELLAERPKDAGATTTGCPARQPSVERKTDSPVRRRRRPDRGRT